MGACNHSKIINAPVTDVWEALSNFHDLSWAPNVIEKVVVLGDKEGNEVGAQRLLNDVFQETLTLLEPENYHFQYSIDNGPGPLEKEQVESYIGKVQLKDLGGQTEVQWTSEFQASDEDAVSELCNPVYQALLGDLEKTFS